MKNLILTGLVFMIAFSVSAQHDHAAHQSATTNKTTADTTKQSQSDQLFSLYYNIKNALVAGDAGSAAKNADQFLRTANAIDYKLISEGNVHILSGHANALAAAADLKKQREAFVALSADMIEIAKKMKPGNTPVYIQYCPMKKASWLSTEKQVRNPYYGNAMLTCGEVTATL